MCMMEISGKHNSAVIFASRADDSSLDQIRLLCDQEFTRGSRIRIMPDVHAGKGCTIGTTMTISDKVVPNLVGVDIGCGMETVLLSAKRLDLEKLDKLIHRKIPSGFKIREKPHHFNQEIDLNRLRCGKTLKLERAEKSIGTLGGGNHFIEIDRDEKGRLYLVVHSGSRHLGQEIARFYQDEAWKQRSSSPGKLPKTLAWLTGDLFDDYMHDMKMVQHFALLNRKAIVDEILQAMGPGAEESFTTIHNYIDTEMMILRKGAVSAKKGEKLLIPINMRDGSLLCLGKGNPDWNYSAPHGAGRLMSRTQARKHFTLKAFQKEMKGIYTSTVGKGTLDECPGAYKSMKETVGNLEPAAEIVSIIRPIYNFKAGD
jgi:tRNA-splicing ligase RtcB (3'-phosphate/5'-hydroxy nucleic acid ligase)